MFIPDVINTLLMGLIFMVIVVTVIRPFVLHIIGADVVEDDMHKAAMKAVEREMLRNGELSEARRAEQLRYQMLLQDVPEKPKRKALPPPPEPVAIEEEEFEEETTAAEVASLKSTPNSMMAAPVGPVVEALQEQVPTSEETATVDDNTGATVDNSPQGETSMQEEAPLAEGEIEIREGETLAEIKERLKREQKAKKPTIPPELLNSANSYEDKVGVVRMVVQADQSRVAQAIRSMIKIEK